MTSGVLPLEQRRMALGATHGFSMRGFQDTPLPLNRAQLLLSCRFSEHHLWMWNTTIQRKFELLPHQIRELLSIIEPPAKGEGLLSNEKVVYKWWLPRRAVFRMQPEHKRPAQDTAPCHLLSPESAGTRMHRDPRCANYQRAPICRCYFLPAHKKRALNKRDTKRDILKPFFVEDFRTSPALWINSKALRY